LFATPRFGRLSRNNRGSASSPVYLTAADSPSTDALPLTLAPEGAAPRQTTPYIQAERPYVTATHDSRVRQVVVDLTAPQSEEAQHQAVTRLASLIDEATAEEAQQLGVCVRDFGALDALLALLDRPSTEQDALRVIGNLASNAVDPNAADTKRLLFEMGAFDKILQRIHSDSGPTVVYALGSVQNMCARREFAQHMRDTGADVRLRQLLATSSNASARHFATGCLSNMEAVLSPTFVPDPRLEPRSSSMSSMSYSMSSNASSPRPMSPRTPVLPGPVPAGVPPAIAPPAATPFGTAPTPAAAEISVRPATADRLSSSPPRTSSPSRATSTPLRDGTPICAVCLDRPVNTALTPCFHAGFCNGCACVISFNRYPCPICRGPVTGLQRIYL